MIRTHYLAAILSIAAFPAASGADSDLELHRRLLRLPRQWHRSADCGPSDGERTAYVPVQLLVSLDFLHSDESCGFHRRRPVLGDQLFDPHHYDHEHATGGTDHELRWSWQSARNSRSLQRWNRELLLSSDNELLVVRIEFLRQRLRNQPHLDASRSEHRRSGTDEVSR